jgi:hypothetical protein
MLFFRSKKTALAQNLLSTYEEPEKAVVEPMVRARAATESFILINKFDGTGRDV